MPSEIKWAIAIAVGAALILVGWKLPFLLNTVHVLVCFLLIVVVLLQSGKAADLAGAFGGAGSQRPPRGVRSCSWLHRLRWACAQPSASRRADPSFSNSRSRRRSSNPRLRRRRRSRPSNNRRRRNSLLLRRRHLLNRPLKSSGLVGSGVALSGGEPFLAPFAGPPRR